MRPNFAAWLDWLRPPPTSSEDDARGRALHWVVIAFLATGLVTAVLISLDPAWHDALPVALSLLSLWGIALYLVRTRRHRAAAWLLVWGLFAAVVHGAAFTGGLHSPSISTLAVTVLAAGLLLGAREAFGVGLACTVAMGVFWQLEEAGRTPEPRFVHDAFSSMLIQMSTLIGAFAVIGSAGMWIDRSRRRSHRYEEELEARNRELTLAIEKERTAEEERQELELELRQAQKMDAVGRLAGGIAHDFNNLLTAIGGFSEMLVDELDEKAEQRFAAEQILAASDRAAELTGRLLAFSRRPVHRPQPMVLDRLVREAEPIMSRMIGEDVEIVLRLEAGNAVVVAEWSLLEQVLINLAVNARDAMPEGGLMEIFTGIVTTPEGEQRACLVLRDEGVGMAPDVAAHAFEPFYTTKDEGHGTGLGLSIAYGIVQQLGGTMKIDSELGRGTQVEIELPLGTGAPQQRILAEATPSDVTGRRILVVEDDDRVRGLVVHVLEGRGHSVLEARSGDEAARLLSQIEHGIDLLVSDVVMPGMNGFELMDALRDQNPDVEVLLMSGYAKPAGTSLREIPPNASFLQKPFGPRALLRKVDEIFESERSP